MYILIHIFDLSKQFDNKSLEVTKADSILIESITRGDSTRF